jgi:hypothetical protein
MALGPRLGLPAVNCPELAPPIWRCLAGDGYRELELSSFAVMVPPGQLGGFFLLRPSWSRSMSPLLIAPRGYCHEDRPSGRWPAVCCCWAFLLRTRNRIAHMAAQCCNGRLRRGHRSRGFRPCLVRMAVSGRARLASCRTAYFMPVAARPPNHESPKRSCTKRKVKPPEGVFTIFLTDPNMGAPYYRQHCPGSCRPDTDLPTLNDRLDKHCRSQI